MHAPTRNLVLAGAFLALGSVSLRAEAETPEQQAQRLFAEANALADVGRYAEACTKLEQSEQLDPGIGTQFNLADCYEHTGRPVASYKLFRQVELTARSAGKTERADAAHQRAEVLEPSLPQLVIVAQNLAALPRVAITVDGESIDRAAYGHAMPVEAGLHVLEAAAPGKITWVSSVKVQPGGHTEVPVPPLVDIPLPPRTKPGSTQRTVAVITGGLGIVGLGVGAIAGILSLDKHKAASHSQCPTPNPCHDLASSNEWNTAFSDGTISTVGFIAGGALLAAAATLWFTAPHGSPARASTAQLLVVPAVGPGGGGLAAQGAW